MSEATGTNSRYIIGIDLGTTNCVVSYIDSLASQFSICQLNIKQWITEEAVGKRESLPSFLYLATKSEIKRGAFSGQNFVPGHFAKSVATSRPMRVIHSAKSWLGLSFVSADDPILPWGSEEIIGHERLSPKEVAKVFLSTIKDSWNLELGINQTDRFQEQQVVITVPASFSEMATSITLQAAKEAGFGEAVRLVEEPLAAFYCWHEQGRVLENGSKVGSLKKDSRIVICDIGGGTTDFTLLKVKKSSELKDEEPEIERTKVSEHLLLGGDNIDLTLAYRMESLLGFHGHSLDNAQWAQLIAQGRIGR